MQYERYVIGDNNMSPTFHRVEERKVFGVILKANTMQEALLESVIFNGYFDLSSDLFIMYDKHLNEFIITDTPEVGDKLRLVEYVKINRAVRLGLHDELIGNKD